MVKEALLTNLEIKNMCNDIQDNAYSNSICNQIHCSYKDYNSVRLDELVVFKRFISDARIKKSVKKKYEVEQH